MRCKLAMSRLSSPADPLLPDRQWNAPSTPQDLKSVRHSMTTASENSLDDPPVGVTSPLNDHDPGFSRGRHGDAALTLNSGGLEEDSREGTSKESVPLAELEEFSEVTGASSDDGSSNLLSSDGAVSPSDGEAHSGRFKMGKMWRRKRKNKGGGGSSGAGLCGGGAANGPVGGRGGEHVVDMNGNGMPKRRTWLEQRIGSVEDLEQVFAGDSNHSDDSDGQQTHYDLVDFAERYFNVQYHHSSYSVALQKTVKMVRRKSFSEMVAMEDLLKYTKNSTISTSLIHLLDSEDIALACSIFKDLWKYAKGECRGEAAEVMLRSVLVAGIERIELRDEILCQLLRLTRHNPNKEAALRAWSALGLCTGAFLPSRTLRKYLVSHLRQVVDDQADESPVSRRAAYCLRQVLHPHPQPARKRPPSIEEFEAVMTQEPLVFRIYFLDGTTKAIAVDPVETAQDVLHKIQEKLGLQSAHGWALYESTPDHDRYIRHREFISDVLADWEEKQSKAHKDYLSQILFRRQRAQVVSAPGTPKKGAPKVKQQPAMAYGKLIMCKRMCQRVSDIPDDPVELHLLYAQALHYVVHLDEYSVPVSVGLHLAGLQAQVEIEEFDDTKLSRYSDVDEFLSQRVLRSDSRDWARDIAAAHKRYGAGKTVQEAELKYLTIVSQFPLYGCTKVFAHYRGVWPYGSETILAINFDGIKFISIQEKCITSDYYYAEIQDIILQERHDECHCIIQLKKHVSPSRQKCYLFECLELEDLASLIECYSPHHAQWTRDPRSWRKKKFKPPDDWLKLYDDLLNCRRTLVNTEIVTRPLTDGGGILRTALNKISRRNCSSSRSGGEDAELAQGSHWCFSKLPFKTALMAFKSHEMADVASRMFNSTLVYTGIESAVLEDMDLVIVVQTLMTKCMENEDLCNEFYLQLIKQTTDPQTVEGATNVELRYWHLMTMATCVMLPSNPVVFHYLNLHLRRYAMQPSHEEGKYAQFCIKSLYRTYENKGRKFPPSYREILFVTKRLPIEGRVYRSDGHPMLVEFDSAATAEEVLQLVKGKSGMRLDASGFALYQVLGDKEEYIMPKHKLADAMYSWERWLRSNNPVSKDLKLIFKKRLFIEPFMNAGDPVEIDNLYNQSVTDVFEQKIPLTKEDATELCALRAQTEYGDYGQANNLDYSSVMRILPRHLRDLLQVKEIAMIHKNLIGMSPMGSNVAFLEILKHWPLYGASMFEVNQSNSERLPKTLWLGVSQMGVHLMEIKGPDIFVTYAFAEISECCPTQKALDLLVTMDTGTQSFHFSTQEAEQISQLVTDFSLAQEERVCGSPVLHPALPYAQFIASLTPPPALSPASTSPASNRSPELSNQGSPPMSPDDVQSSCR